MHSYIYILCFSLYISHIFSTYVRFSTDHGIHYNILNDSLLINEQEIYNIRVYDSNDCIKACDFIRDTCTSVNIITNNSCSNNNNTTAINKEKNNKNNNFSNKEKNNFIINNNNCPIECQLFGDSSGNGLIIKGRGTYVVRTKIKKCSGFCDELLHLCGDCDCINTCGSIYPYYCDCTSDGISRSQCGGGSDALYNGVYNIKLPGTSDTVQMFCQMRNGSAWSTWLTMDVVNKPPTALKYIDFQWGYGHHAGCYWLGLEYMYKLSVASMSKFVLRIELQNKHDIYVIEYDEFYIDNYSNGYKRYYTNYKGHPDFNLMSNDTHASLKKCSNGGYWWHDGGSCYGHPFHTNCMYWGNSNICFTSIKVLFKE